MKYIILLLTLTGCASPPRASVEVRVDVIEKPEVVALFKVETR